VTGLEGLSASSSLRRLRDREDREARDGRGSAYRGRLARVDVADNDDVDVSCRDRSDEVSRCCRREYLTLVLLAHFGGVV
jgi:hypothetical protein